MTDTDSATVPLMNWATNVEFSTRRLERPGSVDQLQDLVSGLARGGTRIRALGSGHSFNRVADTDGALVSVEDLDLPIELDEDTGTVLVGGGTRYGHLAAFLQARGWALHNLGSLPHITVAGACATGTHGSGQGNGALGTAVVGIEFVRADGELIRVDEGDPSFPGAVLSLGALGVVTRLRLRVQPTYDLVQQVWLDAPLESVLDRLDEIVGCGYSVSLFSDWSRPGVVDQIWIKALADRPPVDGSAWGAVPATRPQHPIRDVDGATATEQLGVPGPWNERLPHFRMEFTPSSGEEVQSEYFVAREHGAAALRALAGLHVPGALQVGEIRTIAADDLWLSPFHGRDALALHFTWVDDPKVVAEAVARAEEALRPFDPRPHWGKVFGLDADTVRGHYPQLPAFRALAAEHDPERTFGNAFLETYVYD